MDQRRAVCYGIRIQRERGARVMKHGLVKLKVFMGAWVASQEQYPAETIVINTSGLKTIEPYPLPDSRVKSEIKVGRESYHSELTPDQLWDELERQLYETENDVMMRRYLKENAEPCLHQ